MVWGLALLCSAAIAFGIGMLLLVLETLGIVWPFFIPLIAGGLVGTIAYLPFSIAPERPPSFPLFFVGLLTGLATVAVYWLGRYIDYQNTMGAIGIIQFFEALASEGTLASARRGTVTVYGDRAYLTWGAEALVLVGLSIAALMRRRYHHSYSKWG